MFKDEDYFKIIAYMLGIGGVLSAIIGGLITFIFKEHVNDNHMQLSKNDIEHNRIYDKIDCKQDKKGV